MAKHGEYRSTYLVMVDDPDFQKLSPDERLLLWTLKHTPLSNQAGIFIAYREAIECQSGLNREAIERASNGLREGRWVLTEGNIVWIRNQLMFDPHFSFNNPKHVTGIMRKLGSLPRCKLVENFCNYYGFEFPGDLYKVKGIDRQSIGYRIGIERVSDGNRMAQDSQSKQQDLNKTITKTRQEQDKEENPPLPSFEDLIKHWGEEQPLVLDAIEAIATTRKNGKISPSVKVAILTKLKQYPWDDVIEGCRIYLDKGYHLHGKKEEYLYGIIRGQRDEPKQIEKPKPKKIINWAPGYEP